MTSQRPDRDLDGAGVSIGLAVAGVVAAGVGLLTMHVAFAPLPKPGVPVVISHSAVAATQAAWRPAPRSKPAVEAVSAPSVEDEDVAPKPQTDRPVERHDDAAAGAAVDDALTQPAPVPAAPAAAAAAPKPQVQTVAKAETTAEKLCKAPTPQILSPKTLQPAMILRYDSRFKAQTPDIAPQRPPAQDDQERRLKLSALLANMLNN